MIWKGKQDMIDASVLPTLCLRRAVPRAHRGQIGGVLVGRLTSRSPTLSHAVETQ